jgi:alpha-tubulin suppressor-like RCC1 family protein
MNSYGQLGYGHMVNLGGTAATVPDKLSFVNFGTDVVVSVIATGSNHNCIVTANNGSVMCWGQGQYGELGYLKY